MPNPVTNFEGFLKSSIGVQSATLLHWRIDSSGFVVGQVGLVDGALNFVLDDSTFVPVLYIAHADNPRWRIDSDGDTCKVGAACGDTCIARGKKCKINLSKMTQAQAKSLKSALGLADKAESGSGTAKPSSTTPFMQGLSTPNAKAIGFASVAVAGLAVAGLSTELAMTQLPKEEQNKFRKLPGDLADDQTLATYDQFKPGMMIRRQTYMIGAGARLHYGVYAGKDEKTGQHMIIDTGTKMVNGELAVLITAKPMIIDGKLGGSEYAPVPKEEMHLKGGPKISRSQALKRAKALIGTPYTYKGFSENCETFARSVVEGQSYSTQAEKISAFTKTASDLVFEAFVLKHGNSQFSVKNGRMGTRKMLELLDEKGLGKKAKPLPDPEKYAQETEALAAKLPGLEDRVRTQAYKQYFLDFYSKTA